MDEQTEQPKKIYYDARSVTLRSNQMVCFVQEHDKTTMLEKIVLNGETNQVIIITRSKLQADKLQHFLNSKNLEALAIHGNHRVSQQEEAATAFNAKKIHILITTDSILHTLVLTDIELLISYNLPNKLEEFFQRIAYLKEIGESISFVSPEDDKLLSAVESSLKEEIKEIEITGFVASEAPPKMKKNRKHKPRHNKVKLKKNAKEESQNF